MSFDPNLPQENTLADATMMRNQLNGLKTSIDAKATGIGSIELLNITLSDPVATDEVQAIKDKVNELITALKQPS